MEVRESSNGGEGQAMEVRESSNVDEPRNMVAELCQLKVKICHCTHSH